jgi:hypothetical protein
MSTYKQKFNKRHGFKLDEDHSLEEIAKLSGYKLSGLKTIYEKGLGAYYSNPSSVRPIVKKEGGATRWAISRVYASIHPGSKSNKIDVSHLIKDRKSVV